MTYLIAFLLILYGVIKYDVKGLSGNANRHYNLILIYLILVSGLSYRLGGDGIVYLHQYKEYLTSDGFGWTALNRYDNRMPGWVALIKICKLVTTQYWFFKLVHAVIINTLFLSGIKSITKYVFTGILFYYILLYFQFNFELLRQSLSMALFVYSLKYFSTKRWCKYYACIVAAVLFHESAVICILFPLMRYVRINIKFLFVYSLLILTILICGKMGFADILGLITFDNLVGKAYVYNTTEEEQKSIVYIMTNLSLSVILPLMVSFFSRGNLNKNINIPILGTLAYGLSFVAGLVIHIFYRFSLYFILLFFIFYAEQFLYLSRFGFSYFKRNIYSTDDIIRLKYKPSRIVFVFLISLFLIYRSRMYFSPYGDTGIPTWVQYYPYSSVIFEETYEIREVFIRKIEARM